MRRDTSLMDALPREHRVQLEPLSAIAEEGAVDVNY